MTVIRFADDDQEERIIKLRQELEKDGGTIIPLADMPADLEEKLLCQMLEYESAVPISLLDLLKHAGVEIPAPDQLDTKALPAKLKQIIDRMGSLKAYLVHTNHLSDCELYALLYYNALPNKSAALSIDSAYVIDCVDIGSYEDRQIFLRHYADDEHRRRLAHNWPDDPMPKHGDPPFDRDRFLPQLPLVEVLSGEQ